MATKFAEYALTNQDDRDVWGQTGDSTQRQCQAFKVTGNCTVTKIVIKAGKSGSPDGNVFIELSSGASPETTMVTNGVSDDVAASGLPSVPTLNDTDFTFPDAPVLLAGTQYYMVFRRDTDLDDTNYFWYGDDSSSPSYTDGSTWRYPSSGAWTEVAAKDAVFEVWGDAVTTNIKSINGLAIASVKSVNGLAVADIKSINGLE
jgi:hypothetical protein